LTPKYPEFSRRTQENLITFLRIEEELASTFCTIAKQTKNPEHLRRLLGDIQKVAVTMRHFQGRITDPSTRKHVLEQAARLEEFVAKYSKQPTPDPRRTC